MSVAQEGPSVLFCGRMFYHRKEQLLLASKSEEKEEGLEKGHICQLRSLVLIGLML